MSKPLRVICLAFFFLLLPALSRAQETIHAKLSALKTGAFPTITTYMEVRDAEGHFVSNLEARHVTILEGNETSVPTSLKEEQPGVQLVVAINPGHPFAIRDAKGISRFDYLSSTLENWAKEQEDRTGDDLSLIVNEGPSITHTADINRWLETLQDAPRDHRNAISNLGLLTQAIDVAADTPPREGMGKALLLLTPNPDQSSIPALESIMGRAIQAGIRVFVWMVSSESYFNTQGALALQDLAAQSGGSFYAFSGTEPIPNPEELLDPLRKIYNLTYESKIRSSGSYEITVEIETPSFETTSPALTFELEVLPPNPIFVSPPPRIYRSLIENQSSALAYTPKQTSIDILVEFPDQHERPLRRTTLYVDGKIVDENTRQPFDRFQWDLSEIKESGRHNMQVEAVDSLGIGGLSMTFPVEITVQLPAQGVTATISRNASALAIAAVVLAGVVLALVLILTGRIQPSPSVDTKPRERKQTDPVYQPVVPDSPSNQGGLIQQYIGQLPNRLPWQQNNKRKKAHAYLERLYDLEAMETFTPTKPIPIDGTSVILGTDPNRANIVVEDPTVEGVHARLQRKNGQFYIIDQGSVAGTWVNYAPASKQAREIEHGDLIHIGRIGFRFKLETPPDSYQPVIISKKSSR